MRKKLWNLKLRLVLIIVGVLTTEREKTYKVIEELKIWKKV